MRKCPKCSRQYDDSTRICRTCGSFLETIAEATVAEASVAEVGNSETPPVMDEGSLVFTPITEEQKATSETPPDIDEPRPLSDERSWRCRQCHKPVPNTFDVCWNCGTSRDGTLDPSFVKEPQDGPSGRAEDEPAMHETTRHNGLRCPKCGSSKIIPKARVIAHREHFGDVQVIVYGNPDALIFTDPLYGKLMAEICGDCGHVEWRVENAEELYDHYRQAAK